MMILRVICCIAVCISSLLAQLVTDPLPYAQIANPLPDTMDQLYRDSINLKFSPIRINQAGYRPQDSKYFYYVGTAASGFTVIDESGANVGSGMLTATGQTSSGQLKIRASNNATLVSGGDTRYVMQSPEYAGTIFEGKIPDLEPGKYRVVVKSDTSHPFVINENVYGWVRDALLKFYGVNRCGDSQSWFHPPCHLKDAVPGGWHDCGDHLKEGATMSYTAAVLGLAAAVFSDRDSDVYSANQGITQVTDGIPDILYEAKHGADFVLRSYANAAGQIGDMITSIGGFGNPGCGDDHSWWGRPEYQDKMPASRGGPPRCARSEPTTDYLGKYAANLAFVSKLIRPFDAAYADSCLKAAKAIYQFTLPKLDLTNTSAYNGSTIATDDAAFGALALLWATGDRKYLDDLCFDKTIGVKAKSEAEAPNLFHGGLFTNNDPLFTKTTANTDWASTQTHVLWGFFRLILEDQSLCTNLGLSEQQRLDLIEKTMVNLMANLSSVGLGSNIIPLPPGCLWVPSNIKYELPWFTMHTQMEWVWNRYQAGNITDMYYYYDIASRIQGMELPHTPASTDWKADTVKTILVRMLDYMFGINPWDISMVYGVGQKNFNHPHHRAANPEGKNVPGAFYRYVPPVGALQGGFKPSSIGANLYSEHYDEYHQSETGIDGTTNILMPVVGLAKKSVIGPPTGSVRIVYVGCDKAIINVRQSRYGNAVIHYGNGVTLGQTASSDSAGVFHRIVLNGLNEGTQYSFNVVVTDVYGRQSTLRNINEERQEIDFTFNTAQNCPTNADIENVKVCKVTHDSAEIFWYTPNGEFDSRVVYGEQVPPATVHDGDASGHPTKFHYVKIGGLKEQTKYYFYVESGESRDDNNGQYYTFTTPVEHVNFDVRAVRYVWGDMPTIGLNIMNQDIKSYDSLEMRLYVRGPETYTLKAGTFGRATDTTIKFQDHIMFRVDIGIKYRSDGYQDKHFKTELDKYVQGVRPIRIEDTYDPVTQTWGYYIPVPMGNAVMESGARFRIDISMLARSPYPPFLDAWTSASLKEITDADWSFGPHSTANGDPYDYAGVPVMTKEAVDNDNFNTPINHYITVYRKGEYVWGYSPSQKELETKKTHFEMTTQVTSPINNPSADYYLYEGTAKTISVNGFAKITPVDGMINDIWVNGVRQENIASLVTWNQSTKLYDFSIPVPVRNGRNQVDVTLFAGPSLDCEECFGCAVSNHSFFVEAPFIQQYPSHLTLWDQSMQILGDTAKIDTTKFHVVVTDRNGNQNKKSPDTLYVTVKNPTTADSITVMLLETGDSTNTFQTVTPISVVSLPASQSGPDQISMSGGDKVWITYIDPTDPTDISEVYLVSKADFPLAKHGWIKDVNGDGTLDLLVVEYSIELKAVPDSLSIAFPGPSNTRIIKSPSDVITITAPKQISVSFSPDLMPGVTAFLDGAHKMGKSFITHQGAVKVSDFTITDSAGPVLIGNAITNDHQGDSLLMGQPDTLTIQFSEAVPLLSLNNDTLLLRKNGIDYPMVIKWILASDEKQNSFTVIVDGDQSISEGDSIWLKATGTITDYLGNKVPPSNPRVPITIKASAPRIEYAYYTDRNANGYIDTIYASFSKVINKEDLTVKFSWKNGPEQPVDAGEISYADATQRILKINAESYFIGKNPATSGVMLLSVSDSKFPDVSLVQSVNDSAAPVIDSASFASSIDTVSDAKDTLMIVYSEDVPEVQATIPFQLYNMETGAGYTFTIAGPGKVMGNKHIYLVSINDIEVPGNGDSIWINVNEDIHDDNGNRQINPGNRRVPLKVKEMPFTIIVDIGPNPMILNKSLPVDDGDFPLEFLNRNGTIIRVKPESKVVTKVKISGTIAIYDAMGNKVYSDSSKASRTGSSNIYFFWDGRTTNGRTAGVGTYVAIVRVSREGSERKNISRFKIGIKR